MSDLRDRILPIVSKTCFNSDDPCDVCAQRTEAVMAEVQPEMAAKDTEIARLKGIIRNRDHEITELRTLLPPDEHGYQIPGDDD